ncbi:MAG TPA: sulfur carrier protein ThiS [Acidimicrobiales bacterium]|nr:sulfur carrier protein ThiS [Acidimicrobiales bacterium]
MIQIVVNGEDWELPTEATISEVLDALGQGPQGVAVAVNCEVVPRSAWPRTAVRAGDQVEVLKAAQGG